MRVTEVAKQGAVKKNLNQTSGELQKLLVGLSGGKSITKPSDDPVGAAISQNYRTSINHSRSLEKNIGADKLWLNAMEGALTQMVETFQHVKELTIQGSNGTATKESRNAIATELDLISKELIELANKKEGRLHLFSGTKTFTPPLKMQPKQKEAVVLWNDTRKQNAKPIIPTEQDTPISGLSQGLCTISVNDNDQETPPIDLIINIDETDSAKDIVTKINDAAIAERNYTESKYHPTGYDALVYAEIGVDHHIYLEPKINHKISFGEDTSGFLSQMNFRSVGVDPLNETIDQEKPAAPIAVDKSEYQAIFSGYSNENYLVRVIREGTYGKALFIVSDNGGKTWSQPEFVQQQMEIFNPEGKASDKVFLQIGAPGRPHFSKGLEFQFDGNEFVKYQGNDQIKKVLLDNGIKVALSITASELFFKDPDEELSVNAFDVLHRLRVALEMDDQKALLKSIEDIEKCINQILYRRGKLGSVVREVEASEERVEQNIDFKSEELSKIEDMDLAKGTIDLNQAELKHSVALDSTAKLIQPTLINFLK